MEIMARGGNAIDAAIAANAVQGVVAPETCGIGGDLFALVTEPGADHPEALNASGRAGSGSAELAEELRRHGHDSIPQRHPAAVSIPGCVDGWLELHSTKGDLDLDVVLRPAVRLAREGFPANGEMARAFAMRWEELSDEPAAADVYPGGKPPLEGERIVRPELGDTLEAVATHGRDAFYSGLVGRAISEGVDHAITAEDLAARQCEWVEPLSVDVFGCTAWTVPPNSQGYIALLAMAILGLLGLESVEDPKAWHLSIEAFRQAAADRDELLADPATMTESPGDLVTARRIEAMADRISRDKASPPFPTVTASGGTAYLCVVDRSGLGVSLIQSNFHGIGSGRSVRGGGFLLQDRGRGFSLERGHPNELAPGRRPMHTLAPTLWTRNGDLAALMGTRGGHIQPLLVSQLATSILGHDQDPARAMAYPRWATEIPRPDQPAAPIQVEPGVSHQIVAGLEQRGHGVEQLDFPQAGWGPMSVITVDRLRTGAADPRVDTATAAAS